MITQSRTTQVPPPHTFIRQCHRLLLCQNSKKNLKRADSTAPNKAIWCQPGLILLTGEPAVVELVLDSFIKVNVVQLASRDPSRLTAFQRCAALPADGEYGV